MGRYVASAATGNGWWFEGLKRLAPSGTSAASICAAIVCMCEGLQLPRASSDRRRMRKSSNLPALMPRVADTSRRNASGLASGAVRTPATRTHTFALFCGDKAQRLFMGWVTGSLDISTLPGIKLNSACQNIRKSFTGHRRSLAVELCPAQCRITTTPLPEVT